MTLEVTRIKGKEMRTTGEREEITRGRLETLEKASYQ